MKMTILLIPVTGIAALAVTDMCEWFSVTRFYRTISLYTMRALQYMI
jgi:hypothetical protein